MEAVILIGIQGSGKSTFYRERFFDTHVRISLDLLKTRHRERLFVETCLASGQRFVVDNTNVRAAERAVFLAAARRHGFRTVGYFFDVPLRDAMRRNLQRSGGAKIPPAGVGGTFKRLQRPLPAEGFDELYIVSRDSQDRFVVTAHETERAEA
jgi:predicted kinase